MISVRSFVIAFTGRQLHAYRRILRFIESDFRGTGLFLRVTSAQVKLTPATNGLHEALSLESARILSRSCEKERSFWKINR
jgi:hypothetical protein